MSDISITLHLPEDLVREARALGMLSDEHIAALLRAEISQQLTTIGVGEEDIRNPRESFRHSWAQAMSGEGLRPAREVLRELREQREAEDER